MSEQAGNRENRGENSPEGKKKLRILLRTFGCQMNFRDSEFVTGILVENGFSIVGSVSEADVILFNSCSVRKHAEDRLFSNIASLKGLKDERPNLIIGLIGCTAQNYKERILEKIPIVDLVCGPGNEGDLPRLIDGILENRCSIIATDKVNDKRPELSPAHRDHAFKAYVSISEGCDNFCSYCIVPYVRGRERSRDANGIINEIRALRDRGFKEITLLGQNVNSYNGLAYSAQRIAYSKSKKLNAKRYPLNAKTDDFVRLLEDIDKIDGLERIRFMTSHPKDASIELFKAMRSLNKLCEHLHLPLQSGSDRILHLMGRGYTAKRYLKLVQDYKRLVPKGSITTDIIVGFPSETEEDFKDTLCLMKEILFDSAFIFKYSPRPPAKSAFLKDDVPSEVKEARLKTLLDLQCEISRMRNEAMKDRVVEVLVDGKDEKVPSHLVGRTRTNKIALFEGDDSLIGRSVKVKIESVTPHTLKGKMAE